MGKLEDGQAILKTFGLPTAQQNEAAAYTLLALAGLKERDAWIKASCQLLRIHDIIQFIKTAYRKDYAENTRETIRRKVLHQFETARIVDRNPDEPTRSTNSGKTCYALTQEALAVVSAYGTRRFLLKAGEFQRQHQSLLDMYQAARKRHEVEVELPQGVKAFLSPGRHNQLQAAIIENFWPRFIADAKLLYLGDTAMKDWHVEEQALTDVGLPFSAHDKFPDLVFLLSHHDDWFG